MLVSKKYSEGDIVCFKLVTGEEIIAKVVSEFAEGFSLNRPRTVMPSQQGVVLMSSLISADINTDITLLKSHILMHSSPVVPQLEEHYIRITTGIETVTKGGIIT